MKLDQCNPSKQQAKEELHDRSGVADACGERGGKCSSRK